MYTVYMLAEERQTLYKKRHEHKKHLTSGTGASNLFAEAEGCCHSEADICCLSFAIVQTNHLRLLKPTAAVLEFHTAQNNSKSINFLGLVNAQEQV